MGSPDRLPQGLVPAALAAGGPAPAEAELRRLVELFGRENVFVELIDHDEPLDDDRNDVLFKLTGEVGMGYAAAFEADDESVEIVNEARFNVFVYAPVPGTWYSARFVMDQPEHPDRILVDELDFTTRPFSKIPRPGDGPDSDEHRELLRHDHWRHPREREDLPRWHPELTSDG